MTGVVCYIRSAFGKSLGSSRHELVSLSRANDDLDLDGAVVDQETVQLLEGFAGTGGVAERHIGDATALRVGAVNKLDPLDRTDGLDKVLLQGTELVIRFEVIAFAANSTSFSIDPVRMPKASYSELNQELSATASETAGHAIESLCHPS
jgi:hypothetical protein